MSSLKTQLEAVLDQFWEQNVIPAPASDGVGIDGLLVPLDSITACESLLDIEPLVKRTLPIEQIVKKGGYKDKQEFVTEVSEAVLSYIGAKP